MCVEDGVGAREWLVSGGSALLCLDSVGSFCGGKPRLHCCCCRCSLFTCTVYYYVFISCCVRRCIHEVQYDAWCMFHTLLQLGGLAAIAAWAAFPAASVKCSEL